MICKSKINVRYAETDKMGIVYYANYAVWYEIGRTNFLKQAGISYSNMENIGIMVPVVDLNIHYIYPAKYDDNIIIETTVEDFSPVKIKFDYKIYKESVSEVINKGTTTHCWVDDKFKLINLKRAYPDIYLKLKNSISQ